MEKEKFYGTMGARSQTAASKRNAQLKIWDQSETNRQPDSIKSSRAKPKVQFGDSVVFLAAAQSGDIEEVERLLQEGADVDAINSDGLTGLHQCCIDDDFEMVQSLVKHGANVDAQDNEGWSPLHAAASCGHDHIVRFLLEHNAHPALVNNEGDTPLDLTDEYEEIAELILSHIETHSIDVDAAKNMEEAQMLEDATRLKNDTSLVAPISPGGATLLHVAAAKGYLKVMEVLLSMKLEVDALDDDGWTALHAAVYWRNMEAAELLVSHGADITRTTKVGDTIEDLVDPELADNLDSLKKLKEEHNNRHRRYAVSARSSRPSLSHSNSKDEMKSPNLLRRRSSKERSLAVHKLDKEREKFPSNPTSILPNDLNEKNQNSNEAEAFQDREQETNNSAKEEALIIESSEEVTISPPEDDQTTSSSNAPDDQTTSSANAPDDQTTSPSNAPDDQTTSPSNAPDDQTTIPSNAPDDQTTSPSNAPDDQTTSLSNEVTVDDPVQCNELHTVSPPAVVSSTENSPTNSPRASPKILAKIAPSTKSPQKGKKMSPNMMKRVGLWESQSTPTPVASSTPDSKPSDVKRYAFQARTISDVSTRSNSLDPSAVPSSKMTSRRTTYDSSSKRASYDERRLRETLPTPNTEYKASSLPRGATISPVHTPVVSSSLPRGSKINTLSEKDKLSVPNEVKIKENVDGTVASSGAPTPSSETQEVGGLTREVSVDSTTGVNRSSSESETKRKQHARRSRQQRQPTQPVDNEILQRLLQADKLKDSQESAESSPEIQHKNKVPNTSLLSVTDSSPESSPPVRPKTSNSTESNTPSHLRTKSVARRKPKHPRRSTGLPFEAEEGEHIPEELANFITRRPSENASAAMDSSSVSDGDSIGGQEDELSTIKQQLAHEREAAERIKKENEEMVKEVDSLKNKVSELNRRHGDATRAYEQEKREREIKDARILELENSSKNLQDLKKECQRLKDENSALIRVIGKLSRSPLPTSQV